MSHCLPVCKPGHWTNQLPADANVPQCVRFTAQEVKIISYIICISYHSVIFG